MRVGCNLLTRADQPVFVQATACAVRSLLESDISHHDVALVIVTHGSRCGVFDNWLETLDRASVPILDLVAPSSSFAVGRNAGYRALPVENFDIFLEFDNDNLFPRYWFEPLRRLFQENPKAGLVSPGTIIADYWEPCDTPTIRIDYETMHYDDMMWRVNKTARTCRAAYAERVGTVRYPPVLKRSTCLQEIGLYDEGYKGGSWEDWDECIRAEQAGWETRTCLDSFVFHWTAWERTVQGTWAGSDDAADTVLNRKRFFDKWPDGAEFIDAYMESRHGLFSIYNEGLRGE